MKIPSGHKGTVPLACAALFACFVFLNDTARAASLETDINNANNDTAAPGRELPAELQGTRVALPRRPLDVEGFVTWYRQNAGLTADDELTVVFDRPARSQGDLMVTRYRQHHRGLEVFGSGLVVVSKLGNVERAYAHTFSTLGRSQPDVSQEEALDAATVALARKLSVAAAQLEWRNVPACELGYWAASSAQMQPRLTWLCTLRPTTGEDTVVGINAATGTIVQFRSARLHAWQLANARGQTVYNGGPHTFWAEQNDMPDPVNPLPFRLRTDRHQTFDMGAASNEVDIDAAVYFLSPTNEFTDPVGVSVHWGVESAFNMMDTMLGVDPREGQDSDGNDVNVTFLNAYANVPMEYAAYAHCWEEGETFRLVGLYFGRDPIHFVSLDVVGHELAHFLLCMKNPSSKYDYSGEFASIQESFADILGEVTGWHRLGSTDWVAGGNMQNYTGYTRNLADPTQSQVFAGDNPQPQPQPDVYLATSCEWMPVVEPCDDSNDNCGEYINNGVHNKWFYLLAEGGPGSNCIGLDYTVAGVGIPLALKIVYQTVAEEFTFSGAGYPHVRDVSLDVAATYCGVHSTLVDSVHDAWWAVGLLPSAAVDSDSIEPLEGAVDVHPWPVTLRWSAADQPAWEVDISTSADFSQDVESHTTSSLDPSGKGMLELDLKPDTLYYWRVRSSAVEPEPACYRPVHQFTTHDLTPSTGAPRNGQTYGPWKLPFHIISGERYFDIQLYWYDEQEEACIDRVFPAKSFEGDPRDEGHRVEMTVPLDSHLAWKVRATSRGGKYASGWSVCTRFRTDIPQPVPLSPIGGAPVHPWPVEFRWEEIAADKMDFFVRGCDPVSDTQGPYAWRQESVTGTAIDKNLPFSTWVDDVDYEWGLTKVLGPHWGTEKQPEPQQEYGADSPSAEFFVNGVETLAEPIAPDWRSSNPSCMTLGSPITFQWEAARGADTYRLYVWELNCPLSPLGSPLPCQKVPPPVLVQEFDGLSAELNGVSGPFTVPEHVGYGWYVQALTDDGMEGPPPASAGITTDDYFIMPTRPSLEQPVDNEVVDPDEEVTFHWSSQVAHGGGFVFQIYNGSNCTTVDYGSEVFGPSNGSTAVTVSADWGEGKQYSWRVHPFIYDFCPTTSPLWWSLCRQFSSTPSQPPAVPQVQDLGGGNIQRMVVVFSVSEGATRYELKLTDGSDNPIPGYNPINLSVNSVLVPKKNEFQEWLCTLSNCCSDLSGQPDNFWYYTIYAAPLSTYRYQVRACKNNLCSDYSDWAEWHEGFTWPWPVIIEPNTCAQCAPQCR